MKLDILYRHVQPSPALRSYAMARFRRWEQDWQRSLELRLTLSREAGLVLLQLSGRDAAGHAICAVTRAADAFAAIDALGRQLAPQGRLLKPSGDGPLASLSPYTRLRDRRTFKLRQLLS